MDLELCDEPRLEAGTAQVLRNLLCDLAEPAQTKAATLRCLSGLDLGRSYPLTPGTAEIGRGAQVQVRVRDRAVSRVHARVVNESGEFLLEALGGHKRVYLNGTRVRGRVALADGAVIELGTSLLRFSGPAMPRPPPPPEPDPDPSPPEPKVTLGQDAPAAAALSRRRPSDWVLVAAGATLAVSGLLVSWGLSFTGG